jgi:hypothetical protein
VLFVLLQAHKAYLEGTEHRTASFRSLTKSDAAAAHVIEQRMKKLMKLQVGRDGVLLLLRLLRCARCGSQLQCCCCWLRRQLLCRGHMATSAIAWCILYGIARVPVASVCAETYSSVQSVQWSTAYVHYAGRLPLSNALRCTLFVSFLCVRVQEDLQHWRTKIATNNREWEERNAALRREKDLMGRHYAQLKAALDAGRAAAAERLKQLSVMSSSAMQVGGGVGIIMLNRTYAQRLCLVARAGSRAGQQGGQHDHACSLTCPLLLTCLPQDLRAKLAKAESVLKLAEMCRKLETEHEKVAPFVELPPVPLAAAQELEQQQLLQQQQGAAEAAAAQQQDELKQQEEGCEGTGTAAAAAAGVGATRLSAGGLDDDGNNVEEWDYLNR